MNFSSLVLHIRKEYARDGEDDGWDSDAENEGQDAERKILQVIAIGTEVWQAFRKQKQHSFMYLKLIYSDCCDPNQITETSK